MITIAVPAEAEWIIGKIREQGFEAYAVGGCVRDSILGREPEDWDITTSARPEQVKAIFPKTLDTGLKHGTVTVMKNHCGYEVTTYRIDGEYRDGRHPDSVEFTASLTEDLKRRDFTINAMAYSRDTGLVDEFGGIDDLNARVIRCVGRPEDRFTEDALRILRAVRFAAQLDFLIEEDTFAAVCALAPNLHKVSRERVQAELTKLLLSAHPEKIAMTAETGIDQFVAPGFEKVFESGTDVSGLSALPAEKSMRWAGLLRNLSAQDAARVLKGLKMDNETTDNVRAMVGEAALFLPPEKEKIRQALSRVTEYQFEGALALKDMDGDHSVDEIRRLWREIQADGDCVRIKDLAVSGADLIQDGMKPGKEMGGILKGLLETVLSDPSLNKKEILLKKARMLAKDPER